LARKEKKFKTITWQAL